LKKEASEKARIAHEKKMKAIEEAKKKHEDEEYRRKVKEEIQMQAFREE
jgi:hypothetical protein